ncbi:MAG: tetratricopeptide repeat protein [Verrucomicrobia bacterium]|nr:tetratricopeptide repeat protein [Verrucomicrobiota bacterium]
MSERVSIPPISLLQSALAHHQHGRLDEAEDLYRQVLDRQPRHPDALRLLGVLCRQRGDLHNARQWLERALAVQPQIADTHHDLGLVWFELRQYREAIAQYKSAIEIQREFPEALYNLGNAYYALRDLEKAAAFYQEAADQQPALAEPHFNLGLLEQDRGNDAAAIRHYERALAIRPDYPEARLNLGFAQSNLGQLDAASANYLKALELRRDYPEAWLNLGCVRQREGRTTEAETCFRQAVVLQPDSVAARLSLAMALDGLDKVEEAESEARIAVSLAPENPRAHSSLGALLLHKNRRDEAIECSNRALRLDPNFVPAHVTIAQALLIQNKLEEAARRCEMILALEPANVAALTCLGVARTRQRRAWEALVSLEKAVSCNPRDSDAMINLAICELLLGRFVSGWKHYDARWTTQMTFCVPRRFSQPQWHGEHFAGRTLLLYGEQGFGDTIQFVRYATSVAERGGRVILECQTSLKTLLQSVAGIDQVFGYGEPLPAFDFQAPLLSLPAVFRTTVETIPAEAPYLRPRSVGARKLASLPDKPLKVGLVWCGSRSQNHDPRPVPFGNLEPILTLDGIAFYSFQTGENADELRPSRFANRVIDLSGEMGDFSATAALLDQLDLVISIDTALAHLAGAMGKTAWVLLPFAPDWRWGLEGETCPWYPAMRLFRQARFGDWSDPIREVADQLRGRIA